MQPHVAKEAEEHQETTNSEETERDDAVQTSSEVPGTGIEPMRFLKEDRGIQFVTNMRGQ